MSKSIEITNKPVQTIEVKSIGPKGNGVPEGGATGQIVRKGSTTNFDTHWHTPVKADVGLGNVDNTSDVNKPVSTAQQNALNLKANKAGDTFTGDVAIRKSAGLAATLHLAGNGTAVGTGDFFVSHNQNNEGMLWNRSAANMLFATGNAERLRITSGGNLLVGTTADNGFKLHVAGNTSVTNAGTLYTQVHNTTNAVDVRVYAASANGSIGTFSNHPFVAYTNNTERLRITSDGKVGIGTTAPTSKLEVVDSGTVAKFHTGHATEAERSGVSIATVGGAVAADRYAYVLLDPNGANGIGADYSLLRSYGDGRTELTNAKADGTLTFGVGGAERLRITAGGRVGVGTSDPQYHLHVRGPMNTVAANFIGVMGVESTDPQAAGKGGGIEFIGKYTDAGAVTAFAQIAGVKTDSVTGNYGGDMTLSTRVNGGGLVERARITSGGNLLIGKATSDGVDKLQVLGKATVTNGVYDSGATVLHIQNDAETTAKQRATYDTLVIQQPDAPTLRLVETVENRDISLSMDGGIAVLSTSNPEMVLATGRSYMAMGYLKHNEKMRISANGNLLVGTAVDSSSRVNIYGYNGAASVLRVGAQLNGSGEGLVIDTNTRTDTEAGVAALKVISRTNAPAFQVNVHGNVGIGHDPVGYGYHQLGGGMRLQGVGTPAAPTVTNVGTTGTTSYEYWVWAIDRNGKRTPISNSKTTTTGNATLDATNFNRISWTAVTGAVRYGVLRNGWNSIGETTGTTLDDTGQAATALAPWVRNETADAIVDGNLFIGGTASPWSSASGRGNITINGGANTILGMTVGGAQKSYLYNDGTNLSLWNIPTGGHTRFGTENTERMRIHANGRVAIGTTEDSGALLNVAGGRVDHKGTWGNTHLGWDGKDNYLTHRTTGAFYIRRYDGTNHLNPDLTVNGGGNVLINTTTDLGDKLQVAGNISADGRANYVQIRVRSDRNTAGQAIGDFSFYGKDSVGNVQVYSAVIGSIESPTDAAEAGNLRFFTTTAGASTEKARITSGGQLLLRTGNAAIHDTDAGADVSSYYPFKATGGNGNTNVGVTLSNDAANSGVGFWRNNSVGKPIRGAYVASDWTNVTAGAESSGLSFGTQSGGGNATERMRVDVTGLHINGGGGDTLHLRATHSDHVYLEFFARTADLATRSGYIGYPSSGSGNLAIGNAAGGRIYLDCVAGIELRSHLKFPAAQVASADANTLDDYEEGTFTPTIVGSTAAGVGTYSSQVGRYTKVGNRVTIQIRLIWSAHDGTGNMDIVGLPFVAINAGANVRSVFTIIPENFALPAGHVMHAAGLSNSTRIELFSNTAGGTVSRVALDTAGLMTLTGTYEV